MKLTERLVEMTSDVREQASTYVERTAATARNTVQVAAERVESAAVPIENLSAAASRLNTLAYQYTGDLLAHQANVLTGALHDGAVRLRLLNKADSLQHAYQAQIKYFDVTRDRLARDARTALQIVGGAGAAVRTLAKDTYAHWLKKPASAKRTTTQARRPGRKTAGRARKAA